MPTTKAEPSEPTVVTVREAPIELCQLLKFAGLTDSGGEAKQVISEGKVRLNGVVETQKRKKVLAGDRVEYGDERDPAMRAFQEKIAPLNNASSITVPLFVVQGKNDPRVPFTEAQQIVSAVRKNGVPVWYLLADNEGHGFRRKANADFEFYSTVRFLEKTLIE